MPRDIEAFLQGERDRALDRYLAQFDEVEEPEVGSPLDYEED